MLLLDDENDTYRDGNRSDGAPKRTLSGRFLMPARARCNHRRGAARRGAARRGQTGLLYAILVGPKLITCHHDAVCLA